VPQKHHFDPLSTTGNVRNGLEPVKAADWGSIAAHGFSGLLFSPSAAAFASLSVAALRPAQ
jgi:hypothetical protein